MTAILRPVRRETSTLKRDAGRLRPLVVTLQSWGIEIGLKGTRRRLPVGFEAVYDLAAKLESNRTRAEKTAAKKANRG